MSVRRRTDDGAGAPFEHHLSTVKGAGKHGMAAMASTYNRSCARTAASVPPE
jgi:hypothetical protein